MTRLWWVRHAPTHARGFVGWTDLAADLSDSAAFARLRATLPGDALVISSDLARARATADALAGGAPRLPDDPDLREIHFGAWEGLTWEEIAARDPSLSRAYWSDPGPHAPPGGESWDSATARVSRAADRLAAGYRGRDIVVVAHYGAILTQYQRAAGLSPHQALAQKIDNLSLSRFDHGPSGWLAAFVNRVA